MLQSVQGAGGRGAPEAASRSSESSGGGVFVCSVPGVTFENPEKKMEEKSESAASMQLGADY